jgi:hypothetical protein
MVIRYQKTLDPRSPGEEGKNAVRQTVTGKDDACRCKEASDMTAGELLRFMFSDLTFWKKEKKE